ncbi:MAG: MerC domain-containing protein [Blastocatellia bacterium]|nr:MerC domain-containing protein [Blastocatellia bacterium]
MENQHTNMADSGNCCAPSTQNTWRQSWLGRALMVIGIGGASLASICCAAPFLLAGVFTAIGLGFIFNDLLLMGLLVVFAAVAVLGYHLIRRARQA